MPAPPLKPPTPACMVLAPAGFDKSKRDVVAVVHIGQSTLSKRVDEFASTAAAELTVEEFEDSVRADDRAQQQLVQDADARNLLEGPVSHEGLQQAMVGCSHTRAGEPSVPVPSCTWQTAHPK